MTLGTKIIGAALAAIAATLLVGLVVQRHVIRSQGIELTHDTMRAVLIEAENVRQSVSALNEQNAFDRPALVREMKQTGDLRGSTFYQTIPVVAAWKAIEQAAQREGFEFRIPKHQARNEKNNPTADEESILAALELGQTNEYFRVDPAQNEIVYARPIVLSEDCLACHGDPKNSATGDGRDVVGFQMENWKKGEVHGAFVLKAKLDHVDAVVQAGVMNTLVWVLPLGLLIGVGLYYLNQLKIVRPLIATIHNLNTTTEQTNQAAGQVSAASQSLAEGASEQAASLEETSASLEELSSMTKRNAESAQKANDLAKEARQAADQGASDIETMSKAMGAIKVSSDDIAKIIKTIDEIAFQTNILALNAAVEAARAGEAGMGFAVVADEVRNLAQRCAQAAKETAVKIEGAIAKTGQGVEICTKLTQTLDAIVHKVRRVDELVTAVAGASSEQSQGITQINTAISQMDRVTQSNAAGAEESAAAAEELNAQAIITKQSVQALIELVGGQSPPSPAATLSAPSNNLIQPPSSIAKSSAPTNGKANGHGSSVHLNPASATRGITPLGNDFKRF
jgi:methyl-accepting chemotaxis protein